jgi:hypothetical protein
VICADGMPSGRDDMPSDGKGSEAYAPSSSSNTSNAKLLVFTLG